MIAALLWLAAFCFAIGIFLSATQLLRDLPPTAPVAVGRVTIEKASKLRDYLTLLLFLVITPAATIFLYRVGSRVNERLRRALAWRSERETTGLQNLVSLLCVAPFFLAPFLYLTTFKWGWPVLIPLALSQLLPRAIMAWEGRRCLRELFSPAMLPFHALIVAEGLSWILFRYIATGRRIAHIPTLFLEVVFVFLFALLFWGAFALIARLASFTIGLSLEVALQRVAVGALPLVGLPVMAILFVPAGEAISVVMVLVIGFIALALCRRDPIDPGPVRTAVAWVIFPFLLYCLSYASTAALSQWIDLFHRGESLGPASDYLRGKAPYRDVFVLHGLLDDGQLDAWLFQLFGRNLEVALLRPVVIGSLAVPALWYLGLAIFETIPLALLTVLLGAVTTVDNERIFFEIAVLALLLAGVRRGRRLLVLLAGVMAAVALFFSLDIGIYAIGGSLLFLLGLMVLRWTDRQRQQGTDLATPFAFAGGVTLGAAPFLLYLGSRDALGAFFDTSFVTLPRIIDAVWSLPFPDLARVFRRDLNLHTISDFFLNEHFRFVLNPLVIGVAMVVLARRFVDTRRTGSARLERSPLHLSLAALAAFATLTQRSALGRADFPHQYFSAFLIGPMIVILLVLLTRSATSVWRQGDRSAQAFLLLAVAALLPIFVSVLWVPDIANGRIDDTIRYQARSLHLANVDPLAEQIRTRIDDVRYHVYDLSKRGAPIFDFSNQPAFYFFCDRPNPTRFYQVPILSPREFQQETIVALERAKPPLVLRRSPQQFDNFDGVDNRVRAQAVAAYIDEHYAFARATRGVEIWKRRPEVRRFDLHSFLQQIRIPTAKELENDGESARLIFPSIGSVPGANDSYWRSDLVLHNPFKQAIPLSLRYVSEQVRVDRRFTLGAGQSIRWEDVVKTLFQAPESRGVLWIEYRGAHGPVARVKTFDAAHDARAALDSPLSMRDAATAGSDSGDLTIVGVPGGGQQRRRINIGIVNVGQIPATFRITVHTRHGEVVGHKVEEGLPEDESYLLPDAETTLGIPLDENVTVHVTMVAGSCIAYATVIDANGDNQLLAGVPSPQP
ncbi:MAG: hypothetical protein JWN02_611 [Acidobacteria bacterium]|nr:hypothetical protein [Acidobacteriota bacterium]